jgi:type II secretory pathway pseudopilin PulG
MSCETSSEKRERVAETGRRQRLWGFSMVEMIGVLAVIAVLAAVLFPVAIRQLDRMAFDQETARLKALGDTLQSGILRFRYIPSYTNWAPTLASQAGLDLGDVTINLRNHARVFVIDGGGWLSTNTPYAQTYAGTPNAPINARVMLLSSTSDDLPVSSGMLSATDFANLWNTPPRTVPWNGWNGRAEDVIIQRVNLSPLFVNLVLSTFNANSNGQYRVDAETGPLYQAPKNYGVGAYYLQGTALRLYSGAPASETNATLILNQNSSFVFEAGVWKNSILGAETFGQGDISGIVAAFLAATPNTNAANPTNNLQQVAVVQSMINYMSNYNAWASNSFPNNQLKNDLQNKWQPNMMSAVQGLFLGSYYATNALPFP